MKPIFLVLGFLCSFLTGFAQLQAQSSGTFPTAFLGHWKGKLQWQRPGKSAQEFTMQLIIQPADSAGQYTWQIVYGDSMQDNRPYRIKPVDAAKGHWVIDEGDGILLDTYIFGNTITGAFTVQGSTIVDEYKVENKQIQVTFHTILLGSKTTSGKGTDEVPFVDSYRVAGYQSGVLTRLP